MYPYETHRDRGGLANQPAYFHAYYDIWYTIPPLSTRGHFLSYRFTGVLISSLSTREVSDQRFIAVLGCAQDDTQETWRGVTFPSCPRYIVRPSSDRNDGEGCGTFPRGREQKEISFFGKHQKEKLSSNGSRGRGQVLGRVSMTDSGHTTDKCSSRRRTTRSPSGTPTHTRTTTHRERKGGEDTHTLTHAHTVQHTRRCTLYTRHSLHAVSARI